MTFDSQIKHTTINIVQHKFINWIIILHVLSKTLQYNKKMKLKT